MMVRRLGIALIYIGFFLFFLSFTGCFYSSNLFISTITLILVTGILITGSLLFILNQARQSSAGIHQNNTFSSSWTSGGMLAWILTICFVSFYLLFYWYSTPLWYGVRFFDPMSLLISGYPADEYFLYGAIYTTTVIIMGIRMITYKYRHDRYHRMRTFSILFFQLIFAFVVPYLLKSLQHPEYYFHYFWPLQYSYLFPTTVDSFIQNEQGFGFFLLFWGITLSFIGVPILTYFFGKRWYCSWICGCGGLANTLGDPFRHRSNKSLWAWKLERISIYSVLLLIVAVTLLLWVDALWQNQLLHDISFYASKIYGFIIGLIFAGVVGVGLYPILGSRMWCRYGCPLAAIMGIIQRYASRFQISTNQGQCISCGNCSTYCEMGIDVRGYAQRNQPIIRAACVGCGVCASVCPRGVLRLENRTGRRISIQNT